MWTLGALREAPANFEEFSTTPVLIAAAGKEELIIREDHEDSKVTAIFAHETIRIMKAQRAQELEKLRAALAEASIILPIQKKPESFWDQITLGRADNSDILVADPAISTIHAHFFLEGQSGLARVQDVGSSNGTFLNLQRLQPHRQVEVFNGDCLRFGQSVFYLVGPSSLKALLELPR
ncbi:FHA domain-containing protein [Myxococcota bacterium]|nr:FHA domain-containing protein [Myxococcota bacterium]